MPRNADPVIGMDASHYRFKLALRPFSLVVALVACGLGVALGLADGGPRWAAALTLVAGLLVQVAVNLINDHGDLGLPSRLSEFDRGQIQRNFRLGLALFGVSALLALPLLLHAGWPLLALVLLGAFGALGYTMEPVNYKRRGLGVLLVFWLMGVLMVSGAYLAVTGEWQWSAVWRSLPVACLTSLLLLSNELRDFEWDRQQGVGTLAVRLGYPRARQLYLALLLASLLLPVVLKVVGVAVQLWWLLPAWLLVPSLIRLSGVSRKRRVALTPMTGRFMALTGGLYIVASLPL